MPRVSHHLNMLTMTRDTTLHIFHNLKLTWPSTNISDHSNVECPVVMPLQKIIMKTVKAESLVSRLAPAAVTSDTAPL